MPPMAAIFAIGSGTLAVPKLSEDFSESARDFVNKCLTRYVCQIILDRIIVDQTLLKEPHFKPLHLWGCSPTGGRQSSWP